MRFFPIKSTKTRFFSNIVKVADLALVNSHLNRIFCLVSNNSIRNPQRFYANLMTKRLEFSVCFGKHFILHKRANDQTFNVEMHFDC